MKTFFLTEFVDFSGGYVLGWIFVIAKIVGFLFLLFLLFRFLLVRNYPGKKRKNVRFIPLLLISLILASGCNRELDSVQPNQQINAANAAMNQTTTPQNPRFASGKEVDEYMARLVIWQATESYQPQGNAASSQAVSPGRDPEKSRQNRQLVWSFEVVRLRWTV